MQECGLPNNVKLNGEFTPEKTEDLWLQVEIINSDENPSIWNGCIPLFLRKQGVEYSVNELIEKMNDSWIRELHPRSRSFWIKESDKKWNGKINQTYKVLRALYSGEWECRVCGPVPQVNPQPAARIRALKEDWGYYIASKKRYCAKCDRKIMHDLLVMLNESLVNGAQERLRQSVSDQLMQRIKVVQGGVDVYENKKAKRIIVDHKFPSQRWTIAESENSDAMTDIEIENKFQLLTNQSNMMKSRACDKCVREGNRGEVFGIRWYYQGSVEFQGEKFDDPTGCIGCPWYDLQEWRTMLLKTLQKQQ